MSKQVLILSIPGDPHVFAVQQALAEKGHQAQIWFTSDFPGHARETIFLGPHQENIVICGISEEMISTEVSTVWNRRVKYDNSHKMLHPADRPFADIECYRFRNALFDILSHRSFWVNSWASMLRSENKLWQHYHASRLGFCTPSSIYTNDSAEIRKFLRACGGQIIYKPFIGKQWSNGDTTWGCYTVVLREEDLVSDELLQGTPGIYQELVEKEYELRVTMIGDRAFAAKILSQETNNGKVDWRRAYDELVMEPIDIPEDVLILCRRLMRELDIVFGCFDLIKTPDGRYVFLEVNQQGQFLFVEHYTGLPLLDAFCEFLVQGSKDYTWDAANVEVRYGDVMEKADMLSLESRKLHTPVELPITKERAI